MRPVVARLGRIGKPVAPGIYKYGTVPCMNGCRPCLRPLAVVEGEAMKEHDRSTETVLFVVKTKIAEGNVRHRLPHILQRVR